MVHRHAHLDTVRRTVTRAARPALVPLRVAAATLPDALRPETDAAPDRSAPADPPGGGPDELAELRDQLAAAPDLRAGASTERAQRATRSAAAYLEARRARLRRELRELAERD